MVNYCNIYNFNYYNKVIKDLNYFEIKEELNIVLFIFFSIVDELYILVLICLKCYKFLG